MDNIYRRNHIHKHTKREKAKPDPGDPVLARKLSRRLSISEDVLAGAPVLTAYGHHRLCIENYRSILEYQPERIRIQTRECKVLVCGSQLELAYYWDDCMCIMGDIRRIEYI